MKHDQHENSEHHYKDCAIITHKLSILKYFFFFFFDYCSFVCGCISMAENNWVHAFSWSFLVNYINYRYNNYIRIQETMLYRFYFYNRHLFLTVNFPIVLQFHHSLISHAFYLLPLPFMLILTYSFEYIILMSNGAG